MRVASLRARIFLGMTAVATGFVLLTHFGVDRFVSSMLEAEVVRELDAARESYRRFAATRDELLGDKARALAQVPHLRAVLATPDVDVETVRSTTELLEEAAGAPLLLVADADGGVVSATDAGYARAVAELPGVARVLTGADFVGTWILDGRPHLVAASPVTIGGVVLGLLAVGYPIDDGAARELGAIAGQEALVLVDGRVVARGWDPPEAVREEETAGIPAEGWARLRLGGREVVASAVPLDAGGRARLVLSRPLDDLYAHAREAKRAVLVGSLFLAVLAFALSHLLAKRLGGPIQELTRAARGLARGETGARVAERSGDEIGVLARAFNEMSARIERLLQETIEKARAAEQASEAKSSFLAVMNHELRTPLNGVLGFADLLLAGPLPDDQREHARAIRDSGRDLLELIDRILDFSRIEGGRWESREVAFEPAAMLRRAVAPFRPAAEAKGLGLAVDVAPSCPARVRGAADAIRQALQNLVDNALKFTPEGHVEVEVTRVDDDGAAEGEATLRFAVRDTGIGISGEEQRELFEPFVLADASDSRAHGGSGLGLAICRELIAGLGGDYGVESLPGKGSTFWFRVRLDEVHDPGTLLESVPGLVRPREPERPPAPDAGRADWRRAGERILVAEDNPVNRRVAGLVLEKAGWSCAFAADGEEALTMAREGGFDLILMDCQMPRMDGFEATRRIREEESNGTVRIPIVALTAHVAHEDRHLCFEAGMDEYVGKPFRPQDLVDVLDRCLAPL